MMNKKNLKKIFVPFILMMVINLGSYMLMLSDDFGYGYSPHVGIVFISGLLFGPYGVAGAVIANTICDIFRNYNIIFTVTSEIVTLGISYLAYKLWYGNYRWRRKIVPPRLTNTLHLLLFVGIIVACASLFGMIQKELIYILYPNTIDISFEIGARYYINFLNSAFVFGIIGIWISKRIDFVHIPKISERKANTKFYKAIGILILISTIIILLHDYYFVQNTQTTIVKILIILALIYIYITKPIKSKVTKINYTPIPEKIMSIFLLATLLIIAISYVVATNDVLIAAIDILSPVEMEDIILYTMVISDILLVVFFIPCIFVLRYIEMKVIDPIFSFSKIEAYIKKGDKIQSEELLKVYSDHIQENDEIGMLARSYTDLINNNNEYIENIEKIEGEKHRIEAELSIAEKIQRSILPTESIVNDDYSVYGNSKPAREVGGDFYDYYEIDDENLAMVIGDASGKGVPAALLSTITHAIIKQLLKTEKDPSKVLYQLNNQLCENNTEVMFITLWLGIYNKNTKVLTYSNAGHEAPLVSNKHGFEKMNMNNGIVLGVVNDFEFKKEEIKEFDKLVAYTDGITDAKSIDDEFYGEKRLISRLNEISNDHVKIETLLKDIDEFSKGKEQFDDMTLIIIDKND